MNAIYTNIYQVLNMTNDEQFEAGLNWYNEARDYCRMVSLETNRPFISVCAALAALSPRNKWDRNKLDLLELCKGNKAHKFGTFKAMVNKANNCLLVDNYQDLVNELNGPKIIAFFDNIYNEDSQMVTVDFHMHHIGLGMVLAEDDRPNLSKAMYDDIQRTIEQIAFNNKLRPYELQAILWVTWRELV